MLQIKDLHYSVAGRPLLAGIDWSIKAGRRMALIGRNGAGKTTLLRIINGELPVDDGLLLQPKEYRIGHLPQESRKVIGGTIIDSVLEGHQEILDLEGEIAAIHQELDQEKGNQKALLERLGVLEEQFRLRGGYRLESQAKAILAGLGFQESDFQRPLAEFSGGWRMRVYLARLLLLAPDLLLLDEPTNHLDLESLEWLEQYLKSFEGSIVIVSHDRFFIDRLAQEIYELDRGILTYYPGNYHDYEKQKKLQQEKLLQEWEEQQAERERIQRFIDRFRYKASKAAQVQSRIKQLEKMEEIEIPPPKKKIDFKLSVAIPSYKEVVAIENLHFKYERDWLLKNIHLNIYRGEKIALVGPNGAGKTTLTRLICGQLTPGQGTIRLGERTRIGYYAQHQVDTLNFSATIYEEVAETTSDACRPRLRDILGIFHFSNDDPYKHIEVLSGGEKARVSLAKMLLSPVNFLIMDEPTNHLDIDSRAALESALEDYDGTLLLISHDRYFLDKLVSRVIELRDGQLKEFEGNYSDYLEKRKPPPETAQAQTENGPSSLAPSQKNKQQKRMEARARQAVSKERHRLQKAIAEYERQIQLLEGEKIKFENMMADPQTYQNSDGAVALQKEYVKVQQELQSLMGKWEDAQVAYEALMATLSTKD